MSSKLNAAIIPAGGKGLRFGLPQPKQFLTINQKEVLLVNLYKWVSHPDIDQIILILPETHISRGAYYQTLSNKIIPVIGGATRTESIKNGLKACGNQFHSILIHDGARPFITHDLISTVLNALEDHAAVIPVIPVADTVKIVANCSVLKTLDRKPLRLVQTPQGFHSDLIQKAYQTCQGSFLDDALMVESMGLPVHTVPGEWYNIKITTPDQEQLIQFLMEQEDVPNW